MDYRPVVHPADCVQRARPAREATIVIACPSAEGSRQWVQALQGQFAICEVAERKALERVVANLKPDVLIVDLTLPGLRRVRGLRDIRQMNPSTKIIALTATPVEEEGVLALKAGARGYCAQTIKPDALKKAVMAVRHGEIWAPRHLLRVLVGELVAIVDSRDVVDSLDKEAIQLKPDSRLEALTARQRVVAHMISRGASNKEIGNRLNICERTVKAHVTEAFRNAGVSDRLHLALLLLGHSHAPGSD
jgi:two-component system NarL family response regulator